MNHWGFHVVVSWYKKADIIYFLAKLHLLWIPSLSCPTEASLWVMFTQSDKCEWDTIGGNQHTLKTFQEWLLSTESQVLLPRALRKAHFQVRETFYKLLGELRLPDIRRCPGVFTWRARRVARPWIHFLPLPHGSPCCLFCISTRPEQNVLL